ncbi:heterokaryon incompatibility protein s [Trichoderma asperellum]|uniref:Heterokaryon incompatibility protein s n=1 Tax=Trichoderma asperellum TaxID=101201 RepID=A0A6V8QWJ4_TRIAP|nr:heterokaryon incompatibility protein s [Trichoderma asperellum]
MGSISRNNKLRQREIPAGYEIMELFADAKAASKRFEKRNGNTAMPALDPIEELDGVSALLHEKMQDLVKKRQGKFELEQDEWTLYEEKNFTRLIEDIGELVDGLIELFPGIQEEQRKLCEEEVSEMSTKRGMLPLIRDIAASQDKLLSDTAAKAIRPTTTSSRSVVFSGVNSGLQIGNNSGQISNIRFDTW